MPDEKRLDRIEEKLDGVVKESAELRGEIRQFTSNMKDYTDAVSVKAGKAMDALDVHEKDPDAHGAGVKREIDGKLVGWITAGAAVLGCFGGIVGSLVHKFMGRQP